MPPGNLSKLIRLTSNLQGILFFKKSYQGILPYTLNLGSNVILSILMKKCGLQLYTCIHTYSIIIKYSST